jgi:hypothetical protein
MVSPEMTSNVPGTTSLFPDIAAGHEMKKIFQPLSNGKVIKEEVSAEITL